VIRISGIEVPEFPEPTTSEPPPRNDNRRTSPACGNCDLLRRGVVVPSLFGILPWHTACLDKGHGWQQAIRLRSAEEGAFRAHVAWLARGPDLSHQAEEICPEDFFYARRAVTAGDEQPRQLLEAARVVQFRYEGNHIIFVWR
jgi:hypothetical protein